MINHNIEYLADSLIIEALAKDSNIVVAQDGGVVSSIAGGVKEYVSSIFDKKRPLSSIAALLGRGLLWSMGFRWMSILYTVAEALGFDWKAFWAAVGKNITQFVKEIMSTGKKVPEGVASQRINEIVANSFQSNFTGNVDKEQLAEIASQGLNKADDGKFATDMREALEVKAIALRLEKSSDIIKEAGVLSLFQGKLSRFFIKTIGWLVRTALVSLGFVAGAGAITGLIGLHKNKDEGSPSDEEAPTSNSAATKLQKYLSPAAAPDLFTVHTNNMSTVWLEHFEIQDIESLLISWITSAYPQLNKYVNEIKSSSSFQSVVDKFNTRNRLAAGLGIISVPRPFQRKIDIILPIVNSFLLESQEEPNQPSEEVIYK